MPHQFEYVMTYLSSALTPEPEAGAQCISSARWDLCEGCQVTGIPIATSNRNGTHDVGSMQFNTAYLTDLSKYGITANDVAKPGCYAYDLAAWRVRLHIKNDKGDIWTRAANYHSRTPKYNTIYRADLIVKAVKWANWLKERFVASDASRQ